MECRIGCGACCVEPSISSPLPGMPNGKPAGMRCIHLDADRRCRIWNQPEFPEVCRQFTPRPEVCGSTNEEAYYLIRLLEQATAG